LTLGGLGGGVATVEEGAMEVKWGMIKENEEI
jgi:hypothetical protein